MKGLKDWGEVTHGVNAEQKSSEFLCGRGALEKKGKMELLRN